MGTALIPFNFSKRFPRVPPAPLPDRTFNSILFCCTESQVSGLWRTPFAAGNRSARSRDQIMASKSPADDALLPWTDQQAMISRKGQPAGARGDLDLSRPHISLAVGPGNEQKIERNKLISTPREGTRARISRKVVILFFMQWVFPRARLSPPRPGKFPGIVLSSR